MNNSANINQLSYIFNSNTTFPMNNDASIGILKTNGLNGIHNNDNNNINKRVNDNNSINTDNGIPNIKNEIDTSAHINKLTSYIFDQNENNFKKPYYPKCAFCNTIFRTIGAYNKHKTRCSLKQSRKICHRSTIETNFLNQSYEKNEQKTIKCEESKISILCIQKDCQEMFTSYTFMIKHIKNDHMPRYNAISIEFSNDTDFEKWKIFANVKNSMILQNEGGTSTNNCITYYYYICQHAEICDISLKIDVLNGMVKRNYTCPSKLLVCHSSSGINVKYVPHIRHECNSTNNSTDSLNCVRDGRFYKLQSDFESIESTALYYDFLYNHIYKSKVDNNKQQNKENVFSVLDGNGVENNLNKMCDNNGVPNNTLTELVSSLTEHNDSFVLKKTILKHLDKLKRRVNTINISNTELLNIEITLRKLNNYFDAKNILHYSQIFSAEPPIYNPHSLKNLALEASQASNRLFSEFKNSFLIPLESVRCENEPFTPLVTDINKINVIMYTKGSYSVSLLHLKSLDSNISDEECDKIQSVAPDFRKGWLYDAIIDAFLYDICESHTDAIFLETAVSQVICTNSLSSLKMQLGCKQMSDIETILVPCNPSFRHWILLVIKPKLMEIQSYDPTCTDVASSHLVMKFIKSIILVLLNDFGSDKTWQIVSPMHAIQTGDCDCGVFVSWYAERIINDKDTLSEFNPTKFRKYMFDVIVGNDSCNNTAISKLSPVQPVDSMELPEPI